MVLGVYRRVGRIARRKRRGKTPLTGCSPVLVGERREDCGCERGDKRCRDQTPESDRSRQDSPVRRRLRGGAPEGALFQLANFDIPEGNIVAVILEADVAFG
jgi:hypothetical protein